MKGIRSPKRMITRLLVTAGVAAMLATRAVANAAQTTVATARHAVSVSAAQPAARCANWCQLKSHKAPWQCLDAETTHINDNFDKVQL
jgi:hypothetical protein